MPEGATMFGTTGKLAMMGLGTGLLSMSWGAAGGSFIVSTVNTSVVIVINFLTMMIVAVACEKVQEFDIGSILGHIPGMTGTLMKWAMNIVVTLCQFLLLVGYLLVAVQCLRMLLELVGAPAVVTNPVLLTVVVLVVVVPLCLVDESVLAFTSTLGIVANFYVMFLLILYSVGVMPLPNDRSTAEPLCFLAFGKGAIAQMSIIMYSVSFQYCIPPTYEALQDRSVAKFCKCLTIAMGCCLLMFVVSGFCGYIAFGPEVKSNVLDSMPQDIFSSIGRAAMGFCIIACYPLQMQPVTQPVVVFFRRRTSDNQKPLLEESEDKPASGKEKMIVAGGALVVSVLAGSLSLTGLNLGSINALNGAVGLTTFVGLGPAAIGWYVVGDLTMCRRFWLVTLVAFALVMAGVGIVLTDNFVAEVSEKCLWEA